MVLHSRKKNNMETVAHEYRENKNLRLSLEPVDTCYLELLYSSAHIGLVIYTIAKNGIGAENVRCIGKSSGKLAHFLKVGVPVIMSDQPYFRFIAEKYRCGVCISDLNQFLAALEEIEHRYDAYVKGCIECFQEELNFVIPFDEFLSSLR